MVFATFSLPLEGCPFGKLGPNQFVESGALGIGKPRDGLRVALGIFRSEFCDGRVPCEWRPAQKPKTTAPLEMPAALIQVSSR